MADYVIKAHDQLPSIQASLTTAAGAVDLTGATAVAFIMQPAAGGAAKVNAPGVIVSPATSGTVRYDWAVGDTNTAGDYQAEWQVTWSDGRHQSFPTVGYHSITIAPDLVGV